MQDTIAAIATPAAQGAIGIIRVSGNAALQIAEQVFFCHNGLRSSPNRQMVYGQMRDKDGAVIDRGLAVYMPGPKSYTGEDSVEFFCHGSLTVLRCVLDALYNAGARPAKPGEYTRRALINGRMDLTQAEAVIDLITSETKYAAQNAAAQLNGAIGNKIKEIRDGLLDVAARFYAFVDYPDEEIEQTETETDIKSLKEISNKLKRLSDSFSRGKILREGVKCAIIGRPNVGKSSVLNVILGFERSIVTEIAGTTRDTIEESATLGGVLLRITDTAGIHETKDKVEQMGVSRAKSAAENAELIFAVFDGSEELLSEDLYVIEQTKGAPCIAIINKSDLKQNIDISEYKDSFDAICRVSALNAEGIGDLEAAVSRIFDISGIPCSGETITNPRHASVLSRAAEAALSAGNALESGLTPDVAAVDIENAINILGELTGQTASEEVVKRIFERFCVGK